MTKDEIPRQKLEQLIEELEAESRNARLSFRESRDEWFKGVAHGYHSAADRLREVIADASENGIEVPVQKDDD